MITPRAHFKAFPVIIVGIFALTSGTPVFAQDGSRIVMRRPLNESTPQTETPAEACGGAGNPCVESCTAWSPRWVLPEGDNTICVGQSRDGTAVCKAFTSASRSGPLTVVPDASCQEEASSYYARCG